MESTLSPAGRLLVLAGSKRAADDGAGWTSEVTVWEVATRQARTVEVPAWYPYRLSFSPDGRTLAVSGEWGAVLLVDTGTWRVRATLSPLADLAGHTWGAWHPAAWSPDGRLLAVDTPDGRLAVWDVTRLGAPGP